MPEEKPDWPTTARYILRLMDGWELYDDNGTWRWYSETKPGFDDELPTSKEIALCQSVLELVTLPDETWRDIFENPSPATPCHHCAETYPITMPDDNGCVKCAFMQRTDESAFCLRHRPEPICGTCQWEESHVRHHDPILYNYHPFVPVAPSPAAPFPVEGNPHG